MIVAPVIRCALIISIWVLGAGSFVTGAVAVAVVVMAYTLLVVEV